MLSLSRGPYVLCAPRDKYFYYMTNILLNLNIKFQEVINHYLSLWSLSFQQNLSMESFVGGDGRWGILSVG